MSNLGQYIPDMRIYVGDLEGTEYSDYYLLKALENGVQWLGRRWYNKYLIYGSGILALTQTAPAGYVTVNIPDGTTELLATTQEGDVFRNPNVVFLSTPPPVIDQQDLPAILIAASYLLRRAKASSSVAGFSWSTPDLTFSNIESAKTYKELMKQDLDAINLFFKLRLGRAKIGQFARQLEILDNFSPAYAANWYNRIARDQQFNN